MTTYVITYTPPGLDDTQRESEQFSRRASAEKFAFSLVNKGATKVFLDVFEGVRGDERAEFVDYKQFNQ